LRSSYRSVEHRGIGLDSRAQKLQSDVLAYSERARPIDRWSRLSEGVRFVVVSARCDDWLDLQGDVQQARRGLSELLRHEQALRTSELEGHA
jgi:hypothetical protein